MTTAAKPPAEPHAGHRERLRQRFLTGGLDGFHDYEVIELLLTLATPRKDCKAVAKVVMDRFESLTAVFEAPARRLLEVPGIGPKNLLGLRLIKAVTDRYLEDRISERPLVTHSRALFEFLFHRLGTSDRERFLAVFLDAKNRVRRIDTLFEGSLTSAAVYPREVVRAALDHHAAAVIFAHNHPSGDPDPSPEDFAITRRLVFACRLMDIAVHEHLVIGARSYYSFADQGHIRQMTEAFYRATGSAEAASTPSSA